MDELVCLYKFTCIEIFSIGPTKFARFKKNKSNIFTLTDGICFSKYFVVERYFCRQYNENAVSVFTLKVHFSNFE